MSRIQSLPFALVLSLSCTSASEPTPVKDGAKKSADAKPAPANAEAGEKVTNEEGKAKPAPAPPKPRFEQMPAPADVAAAPASATKSDTGVACIEVTKSEGDPATENDTVKVSYVAWNAAGETVDSNLGKPPKMVRVAKPQFPGWTAALKQVGLKGKIRCWIPQDQAYQGRRNAPEGTITFEIEVVELMRAPTTPEDVAAPPADATKTKSGLAYKVLTKGTGTTHADQWDRVSVHYTGWTTDGKMFDSSVTRGREATFSLDRVVPGWTEGVPLMVVGEKTRFWIPVELAYNNQPGKPAGMLVFDIELTKVEDMPEPPKTPEDVAAAPKDAKTTASGLAYKVLTPGTGKDHPTATSTVKVHYTGWTTDGKRFDSSIVRGEPATFPLNRVIAGWTEGLQLMVAGEKTRFWIPVDLAYKNQPGKPAGMLVFDVELLEIK